MERGLIPQGEFWPCNLVGGIESGVRGAPPSGGFQAGGVRRLRSELANGRGRHQMLPLPCCSVLPSWELEGWLLAWLQPGQQLSYCTTSTTTSSSNIPSSSLHRLLCHLPSLLLPRHLPCHYCHPLALIPPHRGSDAAHEHQKLLPSSPSGCSVPLTWGPLPLTLLTCCSLAIYICIRNQKN